MGIDGDGWACGIFGEVKAVEVGAEVLEGHGRNICGVEGFGRRGRFPRK